MSDSYLPPGTSSGDIDKAFGEPKQRECPCCEGSGKLTCPRHTIRIPCCEVECPKCDGTGEVDV